LRLVFFDGFDLSQAMAQVCICIPILVLLFVGCGKTPETSPGTLVSTTESSQGRKPAAGQPTAADDSEKSGSPSASEAGTAATLSNASEAELNAALAELTQALRKYSFENQRLPRTFGEVVAAGYVKNMHQAPAGKRFEIDPKTVQAVLVKR